MTVKSYVNYHNPETLHFMHQGQEIFGKAGATVLYTQSMQCVY